VAKGRAKREIVNLKKEKWLQIICNQLAWRLVTLQSVAF
jgi:hypothetical protein